MIFEGSIQNRMDAMEIAEEIAPFFQSKIRDKEGNEARYISVHNIDYNQRSSDNIVEYDLDMHLLSDQGELYQSVWIKEFADHEALETELDGYYKAVNKCMDFPDVNLYPLVKMDQKRGLLIYEKPNGFDLQRLGISDELRYFILGRIFGILHGKEVALLDSSTLQEFFIFLINHLPFTDEEKKSIQNLVERELIKHKQVYGGLETSINIRPKEIVFQIMDSNSNLNKEAILEGNFLIAYVKYHTPDQLAIDRMSDIGYLFWNDAFIEYKNRGIVQHTHVDINYFCAGYDDALKSLKLPSLGQIYPIDNTINLQLLFVTWLREVEKLRVGELEPHSDRDLIQYSYYLLTENPFFDMFFAE